MIDAAVAPTDPAEPQSPATRQVAFRLTEEVIGDLDGLKAVLANRINPVRITRTDAVAYAIRYTLRQLANPMNPPESGR